ncbi:MAG TPA: DciA family protein [Arenimonas sp.]|uniref:DciA family protein n=1 Tax=Arenimonas sp. TaxID=1872635 RepID=UPI002CD243CB|nr:DciA family protein [Arenimonas sp.]HMB56343.1 DciA family protein [Arenimonas sp.]
MITFIMAKLTHSQDRGTAGSGSPPQALQAASAGLGSLIERAQWLDRLDQLLRQSLPAALAGHCRLANVDQDKLVFLVNAPVWKNKLRLSTDALLDAAAAAGLPARTLVVKVVPLTPGFPEPSSGKPLSQAVRESLRTTAQSVTDPELRAQLMKLASLP